MVILGLTHTASWNPAACLIVDGKLVWFAEEERFTRIKHAPNAFPENAIDFGLKNSGLNINDIDFVSIGFGKAVSALLLSPAIFKPLYDKLWNHLKQLGIKEDKVRFYNHHVSHIASTFPCSGYSSTNILSIDGSGEDCSGILGVYSDFFSDFYSAELINKKSTFKNIIIPATHSWGELWSDVTEILGFYRHSGEGKTMGLAPYGSYDESVLPAFLNSDGCPDNKRYKQFFKDKGYQVKRVYQEQPGVSLEPLSEEGKNTAYTLQSLYNDFLLKTASVLSKSSGLNDFSITGGCGLNCSGNGFLAQQGFVNNIFIQPASHDAGTALGSAVLAHWDITGKPIDTVFDHAYWGSEYSTDYVRKTLIKHNIIYEEVNPSKAAARLLENNYIIGFFQGRAEVGPRALGNRSILANPCHIENLEKVNQIKGRESWRPLSPSILADDYFNIVDTEVISPFMLLALPVAKDWINKIPAVVHVDGSCRPQTVLQETNPVYYNLIKEFKVLTDTPVVLNTSFNLSHEPIVNSPDDALSTFFNSNLDALIIDKFLIIQDNNKGKIIPNRRMDVN